MWKTQSKDDLTCKQGTRNLPEHSVIHCHQEEFEICLAGTGVVERFEAIRCCDKMCVSMQPFRKRRGRVEKARLGSGGLAPDTLPWVPGSAASTAQTVGWKRRRGLGQIIEVTESRQ